MAHRGFALVFGLLGCLLLSECADICSMRNGDCDQICANEPSGRASCSCVYGYQLLEDQKTCEPSGLVLCGEILVPNFIRNNFPGIIPTQETGIRNTWKGQIPWQVYMLSFNTKAVCEGVLISDKWVITAAHCLEYKPHTIVAGEHDTTAFDYSEQVRQILRAVQHPSYNEATKYENDLALLELSTPLVLDKYVTPICIGNKRHTEFLVKHRKGRLSSWWKIDVSQKISNTLQHDFIKYIDQRKCLQKNETQPSPNTFCAGENHFVKRIYHGNSGAPVVSIWKNMWFLTGILTCGAECTGDNQYDLFTSIANHSEWIHNVTRGEQ